MMVASSPRLFFSRRRGSVPRVGVPRPGGGGAPGLHVRRCARVPGERERPGLTGKLLTAGPRLACALHASLRPASLRATGALDGFRAGAQPSLS
jgi:hypothetical protein